MAETEYEYWEKQKKETRRSQGNLVYADYTKELHGIYDRKLEIFEDILGDLAPQLDDPQYSGTTSWRYEDELKLLNEKQEMLEPVIAEIIEKEEHENMLKDLGWTQEQYDEHNRQLEADRRKRRFKKK